MIKDNNMIKIGPEDIGKRVFVSIVNKTGTITSYTADFVSVLTSRDYPQLYRHHECIYLKGRH